MLKVILRLIAWISLLALILPALLYLTARMELVQVHWIMLLATMVWFLTAGLASLCTPERHDSVRVVDEDILSVKDIPRKQWLPWSKPSDGYKKRNLR